MVLSHVPSRLEALGNLRVIYLGLHCAKPDVTQYNFPGFRCKPTILFHNDKNQEQDRGARMTETFGINMQTLRKDL